MAMAVRLLRFAAFDRLPFEKIHRPARCSGVRGRPRGNAGRSRTVSHLALYRLAAALGIIAPVGDQSPFAAGSSDTSRPVVAADDQQVLTRRGIPRGGWVVQPAVAQRSCHRRWHSEAVRLLWMIPRTCGRCSDPPARVPSVGRDAGSEASSFTDGAPRYRADVVHAKLSWWKPPATADFCICWQAQPLSRPRRAARGRDVADAAGARDRSRSSPGGSTDISPVLAAQKLTEHFGKQFYIENSRGATGNVGTARRRGRRPTATPLLIASAPMS